MLDRLPDTVLLQIWGYLIPHPHGPCSHHQAHHLAPFLRVCRRFYTLFLRQLHREVRLHSGAIPMVGKTIYPPSMMEIIENTCRNADIAAATQVLTVESWFVGQPRGMAFTADPVILETLLQSAQLSPDQESWWREALDASYYDAWLALLLLRLPNLRKLEIKNMAPGSPYLQSILTRLADPNDPLTGLSQLSELTITPPMFNHEFFLSDFVPFTQLPSMRKFHIVGALDHYPPPPAGVWEDNDAPRDNSSPPPTTPRTHPFNSPSNLTRITLRASSAITTLPTLLPHLPHLQSLTYNHHDPALHKAALESIRDCAKAAGLNPSMGLGISAAQARYLENISNTNTLNPSVLLPALTAARSSLQSLFISTTHVIRQNPREIRTQDLPGIPIGDLRDFQSLRILRMRVENLLPVERHEDRTVKTTQSTLWEVLPPSLEALYLEECDRAILPEIVDQLRQVVQSREQERDKHQQSTLFPVLKTVVLQQPNDEPDRVPFQFPRNMRSISRKKMEEMGRNRMAENDIQPEVWMELMGLKERFAVLGVELRVVDKMRDDREFPLRLE
ncbi:hypothetical protein BO78DRAFT_193889 [Aspergillus sclerotiicarbonarius CBS 121057]|uniref:Leucine-rich repeat domain-containing protein n=1 Tax=Aspergillus sclerotiicarbonarius (strain CBS 121057 / IBT 28362) TaxID=1448318 RepID=A0A319FBN1_ASPSB|nr:hypothetical protein BO78DRAFT_193889 [Aspergillus sclerotiicarbonarius CBS 121057]